MSDEDRERQQVAAELHRFKFYSDRVDQHASGVRAAEGAVRARVVNFQNELFAQGVCTQIEKLMFLPDGAALVARCRRILQWSYVVGYYMEPTSRRKDLFEEHQGLLELQVNNLQEQLDTSAKGRRPHRGDLLAAVVDLKVCFTTCTCFSRYSVNVQCEVGRFTDLAAVVGLKGAKVYKEFHEWRETTVNIISSVSTFLENLSEFMESWVDEEEARYMQLVAEGGAALDWVCFCTSTNKIGDPVCRTCGAKCPYVTEAKDASWTCVRCTVSNELSATRCSTCSTRRPQ